MRELQNDANILSYLGEGCLGKGRSKGTAEQQGSQRLFQL